MDLLKRYLQAVKFFLPRGQQEDIIRELSENLISQFEDREEALGRPLTEDEQADILRAHGHPMLVAGRYRSRQQLIGPVFFPIYLIALQAGLAIALIVTLVEGALTAAIQARAFDHVIQHIVATLLRYPGRALMVFGWTTLCFAALDLAQAHVRFTHAWDPRKLPELRIDEAGHSRMHSLFEVIFIWAGIVWLLLVPRMPFLILGPAAAFLDAAPIWRTIYVPILLLAVGSAGIALFTFIRPHWTPARSYARVAVNVGGLIVMVMVARAGEWFLPAVPAPASAPHNLTGLIDLINIGVQVGLAVAVFINVAEIARELMRLKRGRHNALMHAALLALPMLVGAPFLAVAASEPAPAPPVAAARVEYRMLATNKTSTMQAEMQDAADSGFQFGGVMGGETSFGGSEVVVIMTRLATSKPRYQYKLLATNKTSTMQREMQEAGNAGFEYRGQTVFKSTFGGKEVVTILERDRDAPKPPRYEYRLLATKKTSTLEKELQEAGAEGFVFVGVTVAETAIGGSEIVAITRRPVGQ